MVVKFFGPRVYVGGHSKGGNLALVSSMYCKGSVFRKINWIYSNDGPGLRKREFLSKEYNSIRNKYIHIVPDSSIIGVLLRHDSYTVVKSNKKNINGHNISSWIIKGDILEKGTLSKKSKKIEKNIISWLEKYNDEDKTELVNNLFKVLEDSKIDSINNISKPRNLFKILRGIKNMDKHTKDLTIDLIFNGYLSK